MEDVRAPKMNRPTGPLTIRRADIADVDTLTDYGMAMAVESEGITLDRERVRMAVRTVLSDASKGFYVVAQVGSRVIAQLLVTFEWSDWRNGTFWWIQSVYVHPDHRRSHVFTRLYRFVESQARDAESVCGLRLYVDRDNQNGQATYNSLNMAKTNYLIYETDFVISRTEHDP